MDKTQGFVVMGSGDKDVGIRPSFWTVKVEGFGEMDADAITGFKMFLAEMDDNCRTRVLTDEEYAKEQEMIDKDFKEQREEYEKSEKKLKVGSEEDALERIEQAFFGQQISISDVKVLYDSFKNDPEEYNDEYRYKERKVSFTLQTPDGIKHELLIHDSSWYEDAEDEYGRTIGQNGCGKTLLIGEAKLIDQIEKGDDEFHKKMPNLSYSYFTYLDVEERQDEDSRIEISEAELKEKLATSENEDQRNEVLKTYKSKENSLENDPAYKEYLSEVSEEDREDYTFQDWQDDLKNNENMNTF